MELFLLELLILLRHFKLFILQKVLQIVDTLRGKKNSLEGSLGNPKWFFYNIASKTLLIL